jgi:hypothetical protein
MSEKARAPQIGDTWRMRYYRRGDTAVLREAPTDGWAFLAVFGDGEAMPLFAAVDQVADFVSSAPASSPPLPDGWRKGQIRRGRIEDIPSKPLVTFRVGDRWGGRGYDWQGYVDAEGRLDHGMWGFKESWATELLTDAPAPTAAPEPYRGAELAGVYVDELAHISHAQIATAYALTGIDWGKQDVPPPPREVAATSHGTNVRQCSNDGANWVGCDHPDCVHRNTRTVFRMEPREVAAKAPPRTCRYPTKEGPCRMVSPPTTQLCDFHEVDAGGGFAPAFECPSCDVAMPHVHRQVGTARDTLGEAVRGHLVAGMRERSR